MIIALVLLQDFQLDTFKIPSPRDFTVLPGLGFVFLDKDKKQLVFFEEKTGNARVLSQAGQGPGEIYSPKSNLLAGLGDQVVLLDKYTKNLSIINTEGKIENFTMPFPKESPINRFWIHGDNWLFLSSEHNSTSMTLQFYETGRNTPVTLAFQKNFTFKDTLKEYYLHFPWMSFHKSLSSDVLFFNLDNGESDGETVHVYHLSQKKFGSEIKIQNPVYAKNSEFPDSLKIYERVVRQEPNLKLREMTRTPFAKYMKSDEKGNLIVARWLPEKKKRFEAYNLSGESIQTSQPMEVYRWILGYDKEFAYVLGYDNQEFLFFVRKLPLNDVPEFYQKFLVETMKDY